MARQVEYRCPHGIDLNFGHAEDNPDEMECFACYWHQIETEDSYPWDEKELQKFLIYINKKIVQDNLRNHAAKDWLERRLETLDRAGEEVVEGCDDES